MLHDILIQLILMILTIALPALAYFGVGWLREKWGNEKFTKIVNTVKLGVDAVEQVMGAGNGAQKKKEVELWLANKLKGVSADYISKLIDATVKSMNDAAGRGSAKQ